MGTKKHHNRKFIKDIIGTLRKNGFDVDIHANDKTKYNISRNNGPIKYAVHSGMSCYHELRKWLKREYNFNLEDY